MNALSAKALRARLKGDIETAQRLEGLIAVQSLGGKGIKAASAAAPEVAAAAAATTAAAAFRPQRQTKEKETIQDAPRGTKRKTHDEQPTE